MRKRVLGRTGMEVSEIGFGCGPTAALMIDGSFVERRSVVGRALDLGINYFDTAPGYGASKSEVHLGETLRSCGCKDAVIATKVALGQQDLAAPGDAVLRSARRSLTNLGVRRIHVLQLHNRVGASRDSQSNLGGSPILTFDDVLGPGGVLSAIDVLRRRGEVLWFGCSAYGGEMDAVARLVDSGSFDVMTVNYSMLNPSAFGGVMDPLLRDYASIGARGASAGLGVIALRVLEGGLLTDGSPPRRAASPQGEVLLCGSRSLQRKLAGEAMSLQSAAIRHALSNSSLDCVLLGLSNEDQVEAAAMAASQGPLPAPVLAALAHPSTSDPQEMMR